MNIRLTSWRRWRSNLVALRAEHPSLAAALKKAADQLVMSDSPALDIELLLCHVLGKSRSFLHSHARCALDAAQRMQFENLIERRARGEPVAYLTGLRGFWALELRVTQDTLIPRPETELLVEQALELIPPGAEWRIADLGTGSGAIALSIAHERPRCRVVATDISAAALQVARTNAERLNIRNIEFHLGDGDWFYALENERFDMIVSNPPYVKSDDPHLSDLRFEPEMALVAGADGLEHLREIAARARDHFTPAVSQGRGDTNNSPFPLGKGWRSRVSGGWLLLEHGYDQGAELQKILTQLGYARVHDFTDLANIPRMIVAQWVTPNE